jgi:hypothetical protein
MIVKRFLLVLAAAFVVQAVVFAASYRDLLALRTSPAVLAASPAALGHVAETALARPTLTRQHLETLAAAAQEAGRLDLEVRARERLVQQAPGEAGPAIAYGDALRRAGKLDEAEVVFRAVLRGEPAARNAR